VPWKLQFLVIRLWREALGPRWPCAQDLAAGTVAGAAQLLVGHPFDTIKVKLQSQPALAPGAAPVYTGALDATRRTLAAEGLRGLYR